MNPIIPAYVYTTNFIANRTAQLKDRMDRGAGFVEYAALVVLAALVLAAIAALVPSTLKSGITTKLSSIFGQKG